ncbi:MAG: hypothetical protein HYU77_01880 [Betaproteobacteria bacterium]|nr:hypothetical protein [Betaproteobacteria bacterium]
MKLLLLGGGPGTRRALKDLIGPAGHELEWRRGPEDWNRHLEGYDLLIVDSALGDCALTARLMDAVQAARARRPDLPVLAVTSLSDAMASGHPHGRAPTGCGVTRSADGVWQVRCRLKELAWHETVAVLRDAVDRQPTEPVTFEYQG